MKSKRIMPLLLSAIMTVGTATAVPFTASAVETNAPVVSAQSAKTSLKTPKITKAESVNGGVKISWGKVNGAVKYRVYYKGSKGWTRLADTTSTAYTDKAVSSGKNYTYTVRCISADAKRFTSGYDSKGTTAKYIATPEISKLESVNGGVKISWNKSNGAEKYRIYYKGRKGWTRMVDTTSTSYTDKAVSSGKNYTYTVRCISTDAKRFTSGYNGKGKSIKYVAAPKISKTEVTYNSVKISWGKVNGAEKYRVYVKNGKSWTRIADTTSTTFTDNNVNAEKTYTYTVRCINSSATKFTSGYDSKGITVTAPVKPSVNLDRTSLTLTKGKTYMLKATVTGTNKAVSWSSSNSSVASVDKNGKVTAKTKGTATITAKVDGVSASCKVTVNEPAKTTIKLDKTKVTLGAGEPCTLKATVSPSQKITWTSSNPKIVKVDANGKLTVTKALYDIEDYWADVKITAKANGVSATCIVSADGYRTYHKYAIVPVYEPTDLDVCKGCGRLIKYNAAPGTKYETEDGRKGVFLTKEDHTAHWKAHMNDGVPSGWYSEVVMLKVGERVQREGWYVD